MAKANTKNMNHQTLPIVKMTSLTKMTITRRNNLSIHRLRDPVSQMILLVLFIQVVDINGVNVVATPTIKIDSILKRQSQTMIISLLIQQQKD
jgi:hypothetical protein